MKNIEKIIWNGIALALIWTTAILAIMGFFWMVQLLGLENSLHNFILDTLEIAQGIIE